MLDRRSSEPIRPYRDEDGTLEPFSEYRHRVHELLPNVPSDVIEQWLYEHWSGVSARYGHLDLAALHFDLVAWSNDCLPTEGIGNDSYVDSLTGVALRDPTSYDRLRRIDSFFDEHGTWPRPVIFLENSRGQHTDSKNPWFGQPYHLLEGHHRLACFRARREGALHLADEHDVWLMSCPASPEPE